MEIRKAERRKAKLRLGIAAPSGAGKTYSALLMAFGLGGKVGLVDTEHGSGDLYAHLGDYDVIGIEAPYTVKKYVEAVGAFESAGYDTIIIDSLSHAWAGDGGLLDKQGKMADRGANSFAAWRTITPEHNALVDTMLRSPAHIIATMRSKQEYVLETNDKGKQQPKKVGMAPVQREGMEYEFTVMLDVDMHHVASASKDRTSLFDGRFFKIGKDTGQELLQWLETGSAALPPEAPANPDMGPKALMVPIITPNSAPADVAAERALAIKLAASIAVARFNKGDEVGAYEEVSGITDEEEKRFLWKALASHSALRAALKKLALADKEPVL